MRGYTHAAAGVLIALMMSPHAQPLPLLGMVAAGGLGALLPDIDHPKSIIGRRAGLVGGVIRLGIGHRGALHSGVAAAIVLMAALGVPALYQPYALAAALGYGSHILLDAMTIQGVPLFWPRRWRFSILPLRTGGLIESVVMLGLLGGIGWVVLH